MHWHSVTCGYLVLYLCNSSKLDSSLDQQYSVLYLHGTTGREDTIMSFGLLFVFHLCAESLGEK